MKVRNLNSTPILFCYPDVRRGFPLDQRETAKDAELTAEGRPRHDFVLCLLRRDLRPPRSHLAESGALFAVPSGRAEGGRDAQLRALTLGGAVWDAEIAKMQIAGTLSGHRGATVG